MLLRDAMSLVRIAENAGAIVPALRRAEKVSERIVASTSHEAMSSGHFSGQQGHAITNDFDRLARNFIEAERAVGAEGSTALKQVSLPIDNARVWAEHGYRVMHENFVGALPPTYVAEIAQKPSSYRVVSDQLESLRMSLQTLQNATHIDGAGKARVVRDAETLIRHSEVAETGIRQALSAIETNEAAAMMKGLRDAGAGMHELRRGLAKAVGANNALVNRLDTDVRSIKNLVFDAGTSTRPEAVEQTLMGIVSHWDVKELVSPIADAKNALLGIGRRNKRIPTEAYSPAAAKDLASRYGVPPLSDLSAATLPPVKEGFQVPEQFRHLGVIDLH